MKYAKAILGNIAVVVLLDFLIIEHSFRILFADACEILISLRPGQREPTFG